MIGDELYRNGNVTERARLDLRFCLKRYRLTFVDAPYRPVPIGGPEGSENGYMHMTGRQCSADFDLSSIHVGLSRVRGLRRTDLGKHGILAEGSSCDRLAPRAQSLPWPATGWPRHPNPGLRICTIVPRCDNRPKTDIAQSNVWDEKNAHTFHSLHRTALRFSEEHAIRISGPYAPALENRVHEQLPDSAADSRARCESRGQ